MQPIHVCSDCVECIFLACTVNLCLSEIRLKEREGEREGEGNEREREGGRERERERGGGRERESKFTLMNSM